MWVDEWSDLFKAKDAGEYKIYVCMYVCVCVQASDVCCILRGLFL